MIDLVAAEKLPKEAGIVEAVPFSALKNFFQPKNPGETRAQCRMKNAILYSKSYEIDEGAIKELAGVGGSVVFSLSDILREKGFRRGIMLSKMRLALSSCRKSGCGLLVCTLAADANSVRTARELESFMAVLGMTEQEMTLAKECAERLVRA